MNRFFNFLIFSLVSILLISTAQAEEFYMKVENYKEATSKSSFLRFDMASTKFGLVTTNFSGYIKEFLVKSDVQENKFLNTKIFFKVKNMDTDVDGRNSKMWETCLDYENHPEITVELSNEVEFSDDWKTYPATIEIRGKKHNISLKMKIVKSEVIYKVDLQSEVSLKGLEIPDPSILIASVRDSVMLNAHFEIPISKK